MLLFFDPQITKDTYDFSFDRSESKHLAKVLRKETGTIVTLTDGKGLEWIGKLNLVNPQKVNAVRVGVKLHPLPKNRVHLAIAPTKSNDRMEWMVEKLTELGIASITPLLCQRSERKVIKTERLSKIAIAALKQSQQFFLPKIHLLSAFKDFVEKHQNHACLLAHCDATPKTPLSQYTINTDEIFLLIGPEGDFSPSEIEMATKAGMIPVSLGEQRFRTETAGLLGCHNIFVNQQKK